MLIAPAATHETSPACRTAMLTAPGRGAVATLVVFGPAATRTVTRLFMPASGHCFLQAPLNRIIHGRWLAQQTDGIPAGPEAATTEELIAVRRDQQTVEVHCHGGSAAVDRITHSLIKENCTPVPAEIWLRHHAAHHAAGRLVVDARLELARARTTRTAAILLDQLHGSLSRAVKGALQDLATGNSQAAEQTVNTLLTRAPLGMRLSSPWQIALVGETNVGKSSLINAILGYQRALVRDTPGTTRDVLTEVTAIDGWPVELADMAGIRRAVSQIEQEGVRRARQQATTADLVLLVTDLSRAWTPAHEEFMHRLQRPCLLVHNKLDLATRPATDRPAGMLTSAREAAGIDNLLAAISRHLVPQPPPPGAAVPFRAHHEAALRKALQALQRGTATAATAELASLLNGPRGV